LANPRFGLCHFELESLHTASDDVGVELCVVVGILEVQRNAVEVYFSRSLAVDNASVDQGFGHHAGPVRAATDIDQLPRKLELFVARVRVDRVLTPEEMHFVIARPECDFSVAVASANYFVARIVREYV